MTLIISIACSDGVVMAADSASSDPEIGTMQPVDKIIQIPNCPILYGGSGDVGLFQKISENLQTFSPKENLKRTCQEIRKLIIPELKNASETHVPYRQSIFGSPPSTIMLFSGVQKGKPWILEIERDGRDTFYNDDMGNFAAIGSGKPWAQAIFRLHLKTKRDLKLGKIFAYRVMEDSIDLSAAFLAKPIHIFTISLEHKVIKVDEEELQSIGDSCNLWKSMERESVGNLLAPEQGKIPSPQIPKP